MSDNINNCAIHQAEIATVERDVELADGAQDPVKQVISKPFDGTFLPILPDGVNHLESLAPPGHEQGQHFGRVLKVTVHHDDRSAPRMIEARRHRGLMAEISAEVEDRDTAVGLLQLADESGVASRLPSSTRSISWATSSFDKVSASRR